MWDERSDELDREVALVLNEVRALRRKLAEIQRMMERQDHEEMKSRWVTINDRGFHASVEEGEDFGFEAGQLIEVELQIPSVHTRNILAVGEVIRIDGEESEKGEGFAAEFRSISRIHEKAIMRYALIRERHLARSDRFTDD
jgi:c-di-GMP-binding flagellar brake protein YcgR